MKYTVVFEYRVDGAIGQFGQWHGEFDAETPVAAKDDVFEQLHRVGFETRGYTVYEDERLVLGSKLPIELPSSMTDSRT